MAGINRRSSGNYRTYEAVGVTNVAGGNLVVPSTATTSDPSLQAATVAGAGALNCIGVAVDDAITVQNRAALETGTGGDGYAFIDVAIQDATFTVYNHDEVPVVYAAAAAFGARLKCAAAGAVTPWITGTDNAELIIGWCCEVGGVASAGAGYARIDV